MAEKGGHSKPVLVITATDLRENGGEYLLRGGGAISVTAYSIDERRVMGGPAIPVYIVSDEEIASGKFHVIGGGDIAVVDNANLPVARLSGGRWAIPVYDNTGSLVGIDIPVSADVFVPPQEGVVNEGTETGGIMPSVRRCGDNATWDIQETVNGLEIEFTFQVQGNSTRVRANGRASVVRDYIVRAWDGIEWDEIETILFDTTTGSYEVALAPAYTIDGVTRIQVYRPTGNSETLYLDCVNVLAEAPSPLLDSLLLEDGGKLLLETGYWFLLE